MLCGNVAMRRLTVRLLVAIVMFGVGGAIGRTEAAPQVDQWHYPHDALYSLDLGHRICERDCAGEPSYLCDFYVCDEDRKMKQDKESANEVNRNRRNDEEEEEYDEDDDDEEYEDYYTSVSHEVCDCRSDEDITSTTSSTSSTDATNTTTTTEGTTTTFSTSTASSTSTTSPTRCKRKKCRKTTTEQSLMTTEQTTEGSTIPTTSTMEITTASTSSSTTEEMSSTTTMTMSSTTMTTATSSSTDRSPTNSTTSTTPESTTVPMSSTSMSTTVSNECTTLSPSLIPLKNCKCYLYCDGLNCNCSSDATTTMDNEIDSTKNRGGVRRWVDKDADVYARIYRKIQKLMNTSVAPDSRVRKESSASTATTTATTSPTTTERKHNDIMQLPGDTRRRRKLPGRAWNRLLHKGPNPVELPGGQKNGSFKRDLAHRKSEYREELECAVRPWSRKCKTWRKLGNVV